MYTDYVLILQRLLYKNIYVQKYNISILLKYIFFVKNIRYFTDQDVFIIN